MKLKVMLFVALYLFGAAPVHSANVRPLVLPTGQGAVMFATLENWNVLAYQPNSPIAGAAFQIYNPGDAGTPDSTNLSVTAFNLGSPQAKEAADKRIGLLKNAESVAIPSPAGVFIQSPHGQAQEHMGWQVYSTTGLQKLQSQTDAKPTEYKILEAYREMGGNAVVVQLAWPILPKNPPDFNEGIEKIFFWVIESGKYMDKPRGASATNQQ